MARSDPQINFRIPQELKDALDSASAENRRSLTAEVVARLQASFQQPVGVRTEYRITLAPQAATESIPQSKHTYELVEDTAIASDEVLTPEQMELVREAATAAARHVVLHATSLSSTKFGVPSAIVTPPPESKAKPPKKPAK